MSRCLYLVAMLLLAVTVRAQVGDPSAPLRSSRCTDIEGHPQPCPEPLVIVPLREPDTSLSLRSLPLDILREQGRFWSGPARWRAHDLTWLMPFSAFTGILIASDQSIERKLPTGTTIVSRSNTISNLGIAAFAGATGSMYLWGRTTGSQQMRETGILSGEAAVGSYLATTAFKYTLQRDRPLEGDRTGRFFGSGVSFPSEHSAAAWAVASVIAHRYPGPLPQVLSYGLASAVTATRVTSRQHFASDAFVGSALGWYIGRQVARSHEPANDDARFGTFDRGEVAMREPRNMGSVYVPLDSWVYPAFDRLAAWGYVQTGFAGLRPWTRLECVRLLDEASGLLNDAGEPGSEAAVLYRDLRSEFSLDASFAESGRNRGAQVDSVYARATGIVGKPLTDGYRFAQTLVNNFGRPYGEGANFVGGVSTSATWGPLAVYVRGEYQHAPSMPGLPEAARAAIPNSGLLFNHEPAPPDTPFAEQNNLRLLDTYFVLAHDNWQVAFGKQSLWLGPGASGPLMFSDNAEPVYMLRFSRVSPVKLPSVLGLLGPVRTEFFVGRLSGQHFVNLGGATAVGNWETPLSDQPFIMGQKLSFKPTPNLEFGVSRTGLFGGPGFPVTLRTFKNALLSSGNAFGGSDPGDRRAGFDFSYRIPWFRKWLVLYNDSLAEDDISPLNVPRRSAMNPGLYMPQLPFLRKLDFRAEAVYTDLPGLRYSGFFYFNVRYFDGYTNGGNLMGSWSGREGRGMQFKSTYWHSARTRFQVGYRKQGVNPEFLRGGTLHDFSATGDVLLRHDLELHSGIQYEMWKFPLLSSRRNSNLSSTVQLTYSPRRSQ